MFHVLWHKFLESPTATDIDPIINRATITIALRGKRPFLVVKEHELEHRGITNLWTKYAPNLRIVHHRSKIFYRLEYSATQT